MMEYSDRYGGQYPDTTTVCPGPCEGMGVYPEWRGEVDEYGRMIIDGEGDFEFITCDVCKGTGKINE